MFGLLAKRVQWPTGIRSFHLSALFRAEPPKKKQRVDPSLLHHRVERKIKRLEKEVKMLQKVTNKPKPVEELTLDFQIMKQISKHRRKPIEISDEEQERRALIYKEWSRYKLRQHRDDMRRINAMVRDQENALRELRLESEELYQAAIQPSTNLLPFMVRGPTDTPPIRDFAPPDGDYVETTKTYEM